MREDLGFIPSFADWVNTIRPEPWMGRAQKLEDKLGAGEAAAFQVASWANRSDGLRSHEDCETAAYRRAHL